MKNLRYIIYSLAIVLGLASCTKNFEDINSDPNRITNGQIQAYNCFEPILYGVGSSQQNFAKYYNNDLIQVTAFTSGQTKQIHLYFITAGNWQSVWDNYARYANDCNHMAKLGATEGKKDNFYRAVGLILKVYNMENLTDLFGDIPYKEAFKLSDNLTPAFESQEEVVSDMVADLDTATALLAKNPIPGKTGLDLMYGDSPVKWIKLANSFRMRILCRLSGVNDTYWAKIQEMLDNPTKYPVLASNDDNANVPFQSIDPYMSYWGQDKTTQDSFEQDRLTERLVTMMAEFNDAGKSTFVDPRLPIIGKQRYGEWKGAISGLPIAQNDLADQGAAVPNYNILCRSNMPAFLFDYSEILFIEAEGVERGKLTVTGQTAKTLYEAAVQASMDKWNTIGSQAPTPKTVRPSDVTKLLGSSLGSYDKTVTGDGTSIYKSALELILSQKFISQFYCGFEQFNEWRRTEYPILTIGSGTVANDYELPTRMGYPNYTISSNAANAQKALQRMGGDNNMHLALDWSYKKLNGGTHRNPYVAQ